MNSRAVGRAMVAAAVLMVAGLVAFVSYGMEDRYWLENARATSYDFGPCGQRRGFDYTDPILEWTHDGAHVVIDLGNSLIALPTNGSDWRTVVNANPRRGGHFDPTFSRGFHADLSPTDSTIAYVSCER